MQYLTETLDQRVVCQPQSNSELLNWLRLIRDQSWSRRQKFQLLRQLGSPCEIYQRSYQQCARLLAGERTKTKSLPRPDEFAIDLAWLQAHDQHLINYWSPHYPELLRQISDPPLAFFAKGDLRYLAEPKLAIVGSRRPSPAGVKMAQQLARGLAELGMVITSGMALGVDGTAHRAVIEVGAATIAVMGCGLDIIYPARHRALYNDIANGGLLISEYPLGYQASKFSFPQRNRIVSGLCYGTIIIEAAERSGTCITARLTMEQNRELMVLPGSPLNSQYAGSNALIREGAALVASVEDVLHVVSIPLQSALGRSRVLDLEAASSDSKNPTAPQNSVNKTAQQALLQHIDFDSTPLDQIILTSGLTAAEVSSMLLMLELEGVIAATEDGGYARLS